ncbi:MAG: hypothetical protein DMD79_19495 [Candidatus Rokuibacteriota bacterium]|nr:MAG: hypothetical protein DMD79_19495 [Candidatus Rokubacteria bacterium]
MADDATRRLLRVFGIAVTDCEDALDELEAAVGASREGPDAARAVGAYAKAARELAARWAEVGALLQGYQARALVVMESQLRRA